MASPIYKLLNVHDVVYIILGYLIEPQDILNVSSTCKSLDEAARSHLFRSINLPELSVRAPRRNKPAFYQRFPDQLTKYTRLIQVDGYSISAETINSIGPKHREGRDMDESYRELKTKIDRLFDGLEKTLHCVPRLRAIFWSNMPRSLDLLVLVQRNCPNIESLKIGPVEYSDGAWYLAGPGQFPNPPQAPRADDHSLLPLHGGVNMKILPTIPVTFGFPRLTYLSLAGARVADGRGRFYVENIVALLRGSPNIKGLDLTGYPEGELNWVCRGGIYGPITRRRWDRSGFDQSRGPFLHLLCMAHQQSGAEPLKLRFLKLGPGAEPTNYRIAASPQDHYLGSLMDLSYLEELHFEFNDARVSSTRRDIRSLFLWPDAFRLITDGYLPQLRKLSIPYELKYSWKMLKRLNRVNPQLAAGLVVGVRHYFEDYPDNFGREVWDADAYDLFDYMGVLPNFHGLNLDLRPWEKRPNSNRHWEEWTEEVKILPDLNGTRSLRTRMWMLWNPAFHRIRRIAEMRSFTSLVDQAISLGLFPKAPKLREIWINNLAEDIFEDNDADSLRNTWGGEPEEKCQYLATKLAEEYDKLSYVRVDDMAWRIYRASPEDGAAGPCSYPELLPVPKGDVDRELPWAFDTSMPGFQPSHQWLRPVPCRKI
ncbi:hypothetical protein V8F06_004815 [Rhypophila decipiens]